MNPVELRRDLTRGETSNRRRRRAVTGLSLFGMAALGAVTLLQTGIVRHLT